MPHHESWDEIAEEPARRILRKSANMTEDAIGQIQQRGRMARDELLESTIPDITALLKEPVQHWKNDGPGQLSATPCYISGCKPGKPHWYLAKVQRVACEMPVLVTKMQEEKTTWLRKIPEEQDMISLYWIAHE